jgi:DNA-binding MarR family transcriptional regulator
MNSVLRRLEEDGLIERGPHPDSLRADSWSLTAEGRAQLERARGVGTAIFDRMLASLDAAEVASFESYLRRCIEALDEPGAAPAAEEAEEPAPRRRSKAAARKSLVRVKA